MSEDIVPELALEDFDIDQVLLAIELAPRIERIRHVGFCVEDYHALEQVAPQMVQGLDPRKLSQIPSRMGQEVALESGNEVIKFLGVYAASIGVGILVYKLVDWILSKLGSGGSGGSGSSGRSISTVADNHKKAVATITNNHKNFMRSIGKAYADSLRPKNLPSVNDAEVNKRIAELCTSRYEVHTILLIDQIVKGQQDITLRDFNKQYDTISKGSLFKKVPDTAILLAGPRPVGGGVLLERLLGNELTSILADVEVTSKYIVSALEMGLDISKRTKKAEVANGISNLKGQVKIVTERTSRLSQLKETTAFTNMRNIVRTKYSLRDMDGASKPIKEFEGLSLLKPSVFKLPDAEVFKKLRGLKSAGKPRGDVWNQPEFKELKAEFTAVMRDLSKATSSVMMIFTIASRYESDTLAMFEASTDMYKRLEKFTKG